MSTERLTGTVSEYDASRGYGRIKDAQDREFFVHFRDIINEDSLNEGQTVEFSAHLHRKGNIAREVRLA